MDKVEEREILERLGKQLGESKVRSEEMMAKLEWLGGLVEKAEGVSGR